MTKVAWLFALVCLAACSHAVEGFGSDLNVADVQSTIDGKLGAFLKTNDPALKVAPARCPSSIDVADGKVAYCTVAIDGDAIPVKITFAAPPQRFNATLDGVLIEMQRVERAYQGELATSYGVTARVNCAKPRIRLYKPDTSFTCAIDGSTAVKSVRVKVVGDGGTLAFTPPPGLRHTFAFSDELANHRQHRPVVIDGSRIEQWDSAGIRAQALTSGRHLQPFTITCPEHVDLSGAKRALCALSFNGIMIHREVWIDDATGIRSQAIEAAVSLGDAQRFMQSEMNRELSNAGHSPNASVRCDEGFIVLAIGGKFTCKASAQGNDFLLNATVTDVQGHFKYTIDAVSTPAP